MDSCPLCRSAQTQAFLNKVDVQLGERKYSKCNDCHLIFLLPRYFLKPEDEKSRYDLHQNSPDDKAYLTFLRRLTDPLSKKLHKGMTGLDFGCGPGPAISHIMLKQGIKVYNYDPVYYPDAALLERTYAFITATEVVEHFYFPRAEFKRLDQLLAQGGYLAVMTQMWDREERFKGWWYHRESTHVCFYHQKSFHWIAQWMGWEIEFPLENVVIFHK